MAEQQHDGVADGFEVERAYSAAAREYYERTRRFIERPAEEMKAAQERRPDPQFRDALY